MSNNRLFLAHRPSGKSFLIGKRMAWGWFPHCPDDLGQRLAEFYRECGSELSADDLEQDDFGLVMETNDAAPWCGTFDAYIDAQPSNFVAPTLAPKKSPGV